MPQLNKNYPHNLIILPFDNAKLIWVKNDRKKDLFLTLEDTTHVSRVCLRLLSVVVLSYNLCDKIRECVIM